MKSLYSAIIVLFALSTPFYSTFAMTNEEFLQQLAEIETQISLLEARLQVAIDAESEVADSSNFELLVNDDPIHTSHVETKPEAIKRCESIAFDPLYMWKQVQCMYNAETIYDGVFVAG